MDERVGDWFGRSREWVRDHMVPRRRGPKTHQVSWPPAGDIVTSGGAGRDQAYIDFENTFRGSEDEISRRQADYIGWAETALSDAGAGLPFLDIGAGRGEFLKLLEVAGASAVGVEINAADVAMLQAQGLTAVHADANSYLRGLAPDSLSGIAANSVIEHMTPEYLLDFFDLAYSRLAPGGCVILETNNPENWYSLGTFWLDMTHTRPYHASSVAFQLDRVGFTRITVMYASAAPRFSCVRGVPSANYLEYVVVAWKPGVGAATG